MRILQFNSATLPDEQWTALCAAAFNATVFHDPAWSRLWENVHPAARAVWHVLAGEDGQWLGGIPLLEFSRWGICRMYAMPYGSYGGWIGKPGAAGDDDISEMIRRMVHRRVAELVITPYTPTDTIVYPGRRVERRRYVLDLPPGTAWRENLRQDAARNLKTAHQHGWRIKLVERVDEIESLREMLLQTAVRHSRRLDAVRMGFYRKIIEYIPPGRQLFWWTAADDHGPAGTVLCLAAYGRFFYYDGALDLTRKDDRPMYALFEKAIDTAVELGCRVFDFGSGPEAAEGLARFKTGWGARPETYYEHHFRRAWWPRRS